GRGGEIQGRDADGEPGVLARVHAGGGGDRVVGRDWGCDRSAYFDVAGDASDGLDGVASGGARAGNTRLGAVAGGVGGASVQLVVRALQLARVPGFRNGADRQLGDAYGGSGAGGAAARGADQCGVRDGGGDGQDHVPGSRGGTAGLPR